MDAERSESPAQSERLNGWMTLNRASKELAETRYTVLIRCVAGELTGKVEAGLVTITVASVERVKAQKAAADAA